MVKAARSDSLTERVDQLADVYGEVLLGLYDELTDQRERTEAVAARAEAVLAEARRLTHDMATVAGEARAIEQQAAGIATPAGPGAAEAADADRQQLLARLDALERSTRERTDAAVSRADALTEGLDRDLRAHVQQSIGDVRTEVQQSIGDLRAHVRELVDAVTREAHAAAERASAAAAAAGQQAATAPPSAPVAAPDTDAIVEDVRRRATAAVVQDATREVSASVGEQVRREVADATARLGSTPVVTADGAPPSEQLIEQLRAEIERRTANVGEAAERAGALSTQLEHLVREARAQLHDAQSDRAAAAFALRESRAELDAAKRAIDMSDYAFALDKLQRTERLLWGTVGIAVVAILLALWALLS
jgi:hypothetical protein